MIVISRKVDQAVIIGTDILVTPTDVDPDTARVLVRGRMLGGPEDGATFEQAYELSRGQSFSVGPMVMVTLVDIRGDEAQLGIQRPKHIGVHRYEVYRQHFRKDAE